jgi:hypothetical protein
MISSLGMRSIRVVESLAANAKVTTVLGSTPASPAQWNLRDGRKQC